MSAATSPGQRPATGAKSMMLTVLGEFVVPTGGSAWTGTLLGALSSLGYGDRNARQALARLRGDGVVDSERHGRRTRWHITADGDRLLRTGAERIYRFGERSEPWDRRWLVVICAVPESHREIRRRFQTRLSFAGFGFVSASVAVSPHIAAETTANEILADLDLVETATVLRAETGASTPDEALLDRSWDVDALAAAYQEFVDEFGGIRPDGPEAAFRSVVRLVHAWRHFPFLDPELPPELLPPGWIGNVARHLFTDARRAWSGDAAAHYKQLEADHDR